jgi:FkbH-like protein
MVLKRGDIACFVANWDDKASNLRTIAERLNIGLDALAFADDNPFERNIIRRELPMVMVPELPDDPALYARCLADAGCFEGLELTAEDRERNRLYQADIARAGLRSATTDLAGYLRSLEMQLRWRRFDRIGLQRIVQLVNKTNQFNLTTRRYTEAEILAVMDDPRAVGLQLRLVDKFGDNGMISVLIGRANGDSGVEIDTWLMSCRVLGRGVEQAALNLLAAEAARLGATRLIGEYRPTAKNGMVREHYAKLGFEALPPGGTGADRWALALDRFTPFDTEMEILEEPR